ncbi:glycosyltransferase family 25 protein [Vibrio sp. 10N.261.55.A7]|uniref:glycosyltransferase family 25 protein n=1 Tax=Vibrio sp. 10N.261.55.A7 TaxID=1880851 RepID=UPI000C845C61|nr:glycosyltransferase family 25 protein [Vibrio sp. 10N.261.55.A7]PMK05051.1 3-deoxy-D-manno-octulosonic acid transferase [Vibrio sp. 10N.261.55.A7]
MVQPIEHVFVIHVSEGYEDRRNHIDKHLPESGLDSFEYVLDGDIKDLTRDVLDSLFLGSPQTPAEKSCFYKHYLTYKAIVEREIPFALVLEDDAYLTKNFSSKLEKVIDELKDKSNYLINIESAYLSVPFKFRKCDQYIYLANYTKMTGGYIIDYKAAKKLYDYLNSYPIHLPIDVYQSEMRDVIEFNIYWSQPDLVQQGSKNGTFASAINAEGTGVVDKFRYMIKNYHKKYIWSHVNKRVLRVFENVKLHK